MKHHRTSTIHTAMGGTLQSMATKIYQNNRNYKMCDKVPLCDLLNRLLVLIII